MYNDYVVNGQLTEIHSFKFSQDHLETWFSCIRRGLGSNDNPTAAEFKRLYRKLLVCHEVTYDGNKANCISNETGILTVSSEIIPGSMKKKIVHEVHEIEFNYEEVINEELEPFDVHLNAYAALTIEEKITRSLLKHKKNVDYALMYFQKMKKLMTISSKKRTIQINRVKALSTL